jgi:AcrR family transcriptional regulator
MPPTAKTRARPRKIPTQERSRAMVSVILEAATRVLMKEGYARATTNRIAKAAGISVGSFYQYFPTKDAVVVALMRRHREKMRALLEGHVERFRTSPLEEAVPALIAAVFAVHESNPKLHAVMFEHVLRSDARRELDEFEPWVEKVVEEALALHRARLRVKDTRAAAFVVVHLVTGVSRAAAGSPHEHLERELSDAVLRYLLA